MTKKCDPIFSIFNLLRYAHGLNKERVKFYGLKDLETITLINIGIIKNPTQKDICDRLKSPKQTINNVIKNLVDKGLIVLDQSLEDKRIKILRLTDKGIKNRDDNLKPLLEANKRMYEQLGEEKVVEITRALELLIEAIRGNFEKEDR